MTPSELTLTISEVREHLKIVTDLRKRAYNGNTYGKGAYGQLCEIGLDTTNIYKSALVLEEQLTYQLNVAVQTLKLMQDVEVYNSNEIVDE